MISDDGAKFISEILTTFALTHEEVVTRRQMKSTYVPDDGTNSPSQHTVSTVGGGQERPPTATRSFSKEEKRGSNSKNSIKDKKKLDHNNSKLKDNGVKRGL